MNLKLTVALIDIDLHNGWKLKGRIVNVSGNEVRDRALIGTPIVMSVSREVHVSKIALRPGILCLVEVSRDEAEAALTEIGEKESTTFITSPISVGHMVEPCVRVPLSLLQELRGQIAPTEFARRALVQVWSEDRKTGNA